MRLTKTIIVIANYKHRCSSPKAQSSAVIAVTADLLEQLTAGGYQVASVMH